MAKLDEEAGTWKLFSRDSAEEEVPSLSSVDGSYSILSNVFCAVFRMNGELFVRIGDTQVVLSEEVELIVDGPPEERCLSLVVGGIPRLTHNYWLEVTAIEGDVTPFIEDEDSDFGVFLSNISRSPKRQATLRGAP